MAESDKKEETEEVWSALIICKSRKAKEVEPISGFPVIVTYCQDGTEHSKKVLCASAFDAKADETIEKIRHFKGFNPKKLYECCTIRNGGIYRGFEISIIGHENEREKLERMLKKAVKKFKASYNISKEEEYENLTEEQKNQLPEWIPIEPEQ